jgi:hypothetical protein
MSCRESPLPVCCSCRVHVTRLAFVFFGSELDLKSESELNPASEPDELTSHTLCPVRSI